MVSVFAICTEPLDINSSKIIKKKCFGAIKPSQCIFNSPLKSFICFHISGRRPSLSTTPFFRFCRCIFHPPFTAPSVSLSLFALCHYALTIVGRAHLVRAHRFNKILCVRVALACSLDSVNMTCAVLLILATVNTVRVPVHVWRRGCALYRTSSIFPNVISSMWKEQAGCSSFSRPLP